jgi:hypothetical protein
LRRAHTFIKLTILLSYRFLLFVPLLVSTLLPGSALAQQHEVGFGLGGFNYTGDLARDFAVRHTRPGLGLLYRYNVNNHLSLRGALHGGWIAGSDTPPTTPWPPSAIPPLVPESPN